ncbi:MAG: chemotaxis response regulator protein-glutamate methylesterase [Polyangiaceae bacterium]|nr:chemotaxis response regulator protein-glutamate methylesterase [Polyangiaceae bacterium]
MSSPKDISLRVLVVDDSAVNRRSISDMLKGISGIEVVGKAANGEEALQLLRVCQPNVITLDLEMPKIDGFTFLRILMAKSPLPTIIISSYAQRENVFTALELGALDFITKPDVLKPGDHCIREQLISKLLQLRGVERFQSPRRSSSQLRSSGEGKTYSRRAPSQIVVIGASTGGPSALMEIFSSIPATSSSAYLIAQHMPDKFTTTFAERLNRRCPLQVKEAKDGDEILAGQVFICPGFKSMEIEPGPGALQRVRIIPARGDDRFHPSVDRLFASAAAHCPTQTLGLILTGMASDGAEGAKLLGEKGGYIIAESAETAVIFGMPRAVIDLGAAHEVSPLDQIAQRISELEGRD